MRKMMRIVSLLLAACLMFGLVGCGKKTMTKEQYEELANTNAERNKKNVLLRVTTATESYEVTAYDMVYCLALNEREGMEIKTKNNAYYQSVYGTDYNFWELTDTNGNKMRDGYKSQAFSTMAYTIVFYNEAKAHGVTLEESRRVQIQSVTERFLAGFTDEQRARCGMTAACIADAYEKVFLADQYIQMLSADFKIDEKAVRASVDKEDYRAYETDYLYVAKHDYDENYHTVEFTEEELNARKEAMADSFERTKLGEEMTAIRVSYDEIMSYGTRDFFRTETAIEPDYIKLVSTMKPGDVELLETASGMYVIKLENNTRFVGYEEAVEKAFELAKASGVADEYKKVVESYSIAKTENWEAIRMGSFAYNGK